MLALSSRTTGSAASCSSNHPEEVGGAYKVAALLREHSLLSHLAAGVVCGGSDTGPRVASKPSAEGRKDGTKEDETAEKCLEVCLLSPDE